MVVVKNVSCRDRRISRRQQFAINWRHAHQCAQLAFSEVQTTATTVTTQSDLNFTSIAVVFCSRLCFLVRFSAFQFCFGFGANGLPSLVGQFT